VSGQLQSILLIECGMPKEGGTKLRPIVFLRRQAFSNKSLSVGGLEPAAAVKDIGDRPRTKVLPLISDKTASFLDFRSLGQ
jgi:hypothetical protein